MKCIVGIIVLIGTLVLGTTTTELSVDDGRYGENEITAIQKRDLEQITCVWSSWSLYSPCSSPCGPGLQSRRQICLCQNTTSGEEIPAQDFDCPGSVPFQTISCNGTCVPVVCNWTTWGEWSLCSLRCGGSGSQTRFRNCRCPDGSGSPGFDCIGLPFDVRNCNSFPCCEYVGDWSEWSTCTACYPGTNKTRVRGCACVPNSPITTCFGSPPTDSEPCNSTDCCAYTSEWTSWGPCTAVCGSSGVQHRFSTCQCAPGFPQPFVCPGTPNISSQPCNRRPCQNNTIICALSWLPWSTGCVGSCPSGFQHRNATCVCVDTETSTIIPAGDPRENCTGTTSELRNCTTSTCCSYPGYGSWSPCSLECGGGTQTRSGNCTCNGIPSDPLNCIYGGVPALPVQTQSCNTQPCCQWSGWDQWSTCFGTCGTGIQYRNALCSCFGSEVNISNCLAEGLLLPPPMSQSCPLQQPCCTWSDWNSEWTPCSTDCGGGTQYRIPFCACGGVISTILEPCLIVSFPQIQDRTCNTQSCCDWGEWLPWSPCSVMCDIGVQNRSAGCYCAGVLSPNEICEVIGPQPMQNGSCGGPTCCSWAEWQEWSACNTACGGEGTKSRVPYCRCYGNISNFLNCVGPGNSSFPVETELCYNPCCETYWTSWSQCSTPCGMGVHNRSSICYCDNTLVPSSFCNALPIEIHLCQIQPCCEFSSWTEWSECTTQCNSGRQFRLGVCTCNGNVSLPEFCASSTPDGLRPTDVRDCNTQSCNPFPCSWSEWGPYTNCSRNCGGGTLDRYRECRCNGISRLPEQCGGTYLDLAEWHLCNAQPCPIPPPDCVWTEWSPFTGCTRVCNTGTQYRHRECMCDMVTSDSFFCNGTTRDAFELVTCNDNPCTNNPCTYTDWAPWSQCSSTCGIGTMDRGRFCVCFDSPVPVLGNYCSTVDQRLVDTVICNNPPCISPPIVCEFSQWTAWSPCPTTCLAGSVSERQRQCLCDGQARDPYFCGGTYMDTMEMFPCYISCPNPNCSFTPWGNWTPCSATCGFGATDRFRDCKCDNVSQPAQACGGQDSNLIDWEVCYTQPCNQSVCVVTEWTDWLPCSRPCGTGVTDRFRQCVCDGIYALPSRCGLTNQDLFEWVPCNTFNCTEVENLCYLTTWTGWSDCVPFGCPGIQLRYRTCLCTNLTVDNSGLSCGVTATSLTQSQICVGSCVCDWSTWNSWSLCSAGCTPGGFQTRQRDCRCGGYLFPPENCNGTYFDQLGAQTCNSLIPCPPSPTPGCSFQEWTVWSPCSANCGGGTSFRSQYCLCGQYYVPPWYCGASANSTNSLTTCNTQSCVAGPILPCDFSEWSSWSPCTRNCGSGSTFRSRYCFCANTVYPSSACGGGNILETSPCNTQQCTVTCSWNSWGVWSDCSVPCAAGVRLRSRQCACTDFIIRNSTFCDFYAIYPSTYYNYDLINLLAASTAFPSQGLFGGRTRGDTGRSLGSSTTGSSSGLVPTNFRKRNVEQISDNLVTGPLQSQPCIGPSGPTCPSNLTIVPCQFTSTIYTSGALRPIDANGTVTVSATDSSINFAISSNPGSLLLSGVDIYVSTSAPGTSIGDGQWTSTQIFPTPVSNINIVLPLPTTTTNCRTLFIAVRAFYSANSMVYPRGIEGWMHGPVVLSNQAHIGSVAPPFSDVPAQTPYGWYTSCDQNCPTTTTPPAPVNTSTCCDCPNNNPFTCPTIGYDIILADTGLYGGAVFVTSNEYGIKFEVTLAEIYTSYIYIYVGTNPIPIDIAQYPAIYSFNPPVITWDGPVIPWHVFQEQFPGGLTCGQLVNVSVVLVVQNINTMIPEIAWLRGESSVVPNWGYYTRYATCCDQGKSIPFSTVNPYAPAPNSGCVNTMNYWRLHHSGASFPSLNIPWPIPESTRFSCPVASHYAPFTFLEILSNPPTDAWTFLAQEYITAMLNVVSGAAPDSISQTLLQTSSLLSTCTPFTSPDLSSSAISLANTLKNFNTGLLGPVLCASSAPYLFNPCPCLCALASTVNQGGPGTVAFDYFLTENATRVYTIQIPENPAPGTIPLVTVSNIVGGVVAYVTDDRGFHQIPASGYFAPVSASGVIRVTLVGSGPANFGQVVVTDTTLPPGVSLLLGMENNQNFEQSTENQNFLLGIEIGVPIGIIFVVAVVTAIIIFKFKLLKCNKSL